MRRIAYWLLLLLALVLSEAGVAASSACSNPNPLRFSLVPRNDPARQLEEHRPLIRQLERALHRKVMVVQVSSYGAVIEGLLAGTIDLASMGPASYSIARNRDASITPFVTWTMEGGTFVKQGSYTYNSLLVTRRDSNIKSVDDLRNGRIGLTDPASTSGAVIPRTEFAAAVGTPLDEFAGSVIYSGSHDRSILALQKGQVDAVFVASEHLDRAIRDGRLAANDIAVLWQSTPIPHDPFVLRGALCAELEDQIRAAFMADTPDIRAMRKNLSAERFVPVTDEMYRPIRRIINRNE